MNRLKSRPGPWWKVAIGLLPPFTVFALYGAVPDAVAVAAGVLVLVVIVAYFALVEPERRPHLTNRQIWGVIALTFGVGWLLIALGNLIWATGPFRSFGSFVVIAVGIVLLSPISGPNLSDPDKWSWIAANNKPSRYSAKAVAHPRRFAATRALWGAALGGTLGFLVGWTLVDTVLYAVTLAVAGLICAYLLWRPGGPAERRFREAVAADPSVATRDTPKEWRTAAIISPLALAAIGVSAFSQDRWTAGLVAMLIGAAAGVYCYAKYRLSTREGR